jgi:hypothetical protein
VDEGGVPRDVLFPVELLGARAQVSILEKFSGRRPSMSEVASIPDAELLKLSGFGPSTIRQVHSITQGGLASSSAMTGLSDDELLSERDRLLAELTEVRETLKRREQELRRRLRAVTLELRVRGPSQNEGSR